MLWFKLSATFHEHPKMLAVRKAAGSHADSAELGWYRLLMAAKRHERWSFASEEHLQHVAGSFYRYVELYRSAHLLDGLIVHDGASYNAVKSPAERKAEQRERDSMSREYVTMQRDPKRDAMSRLERESRETERVERPARDALPPLADGYGGRENFDGRADLEAFLVITRRAPTPRQRRLLDDVLDRRDLTGPAWAADVMYRHPDDPIGAVIEADKAWRDERIAEAQAAEKPKPQPRRSQGLPQTTREIMAEMALLRGETA